MPDNLPPNVPDSLKDQTAENHRYPLSFHGQGAEYFRIWIVNVLLSIVTLGIYSAWAKVRTERYFHDAVELDGLRFGYHGRPLSILIGRAIALAFFLPYSLLQKTQPLYASIFLIGGLLVMPWLIVRALRFRLRVTSYRGLRFGFSHEKGVMAGAYRCFLGLLLLATLSLSLLAPYMWHEQYRWMVRNSRYGATPMLMEKALGRFYKLGALILLVLIALIGAMFLIVGLAFYDSGGTPPLWLEIGPAVCVFVAVMITKVTDLWLRKTMWENVRIGTLRVTVEWKVLPVVWLLISNLLLMVCSLGLAYPWVRCRRARYMLDRVTIIAPDGLDHFVAGADDGSSAIADQMASIFDIDIGIGF